MLFRDPGKVCGRSRSSIGRSGNGRGSGLLTLCHNLRAVVTFPPARRVGITQQIHIIVRRAGVTTAVIYEANRAESAVRSLSATAAKYPRCGVPGVRVSLGIPELDPLRRT